MNDDIQVNPGKELRFAMTMVTATHQYLTERMTAADYHQVIEGAIADLDPQETADILRPCLYMNVRLAAMFAEATGTDVETVLGFLGSEVAQLPEE